MTKTIGPAAGPRVLISSTQKLFAHSLAAALRHRHAIDVMDLHPASGRGTVAASGEHLPDVTVAGAWMPDMSGAEMAAKIARATPNTRVILVSAQYSLQQVTEAIAAGAAGYVPSSISVAKMAEGILRAHAGESPVFGRELGQMMSAMDWRLAQSHEALKRLGDLTGRERTIMGWLATGASPEEIARHLFITPKTVKNHLQNILRKTGSGSRQELLQLGRSSGMLASLPSAHDTRSSGRDH
ncbi:MAG: LuxR C-terminal-related transcriptional regulator [Actinomycetota bacterium]